jgi:hypothetical protein
MSKSTAVSREGPQRQQSREQFWRKTLRRFAGSGQSIRAFCREQRISEPSFYAWRRTLRQLDAQHTRFAPPAGATPAFLPVRLTDDAATASANSASAIAGRIEIALVSGHRIRLHAPVDSAALAPILAALQAHPAGGSPC